MKDSPGLEASDFMKKMLAIESRLNITILQNIATNDILSRMKQFILATITLTTLLVSSLHPTFAAPSTAGTQPPPGASFTYTSEGTNKPTVENNPNYYISLRWIVYMMILSLPFAPSQTVYAPINIPVHLPSLSLPKSKPPAKLPSLSIPKPRPPVKRPNL